MSSITEIIKYLLALKTALYPMNYNMQEYGDLYWWQKELPADEGCLLYGKTKDARAWLEVRKGNETQVQEPVVGEATSSELYEDFFALYQRLQRDGDRVELVWGHALLVWEQAGKKLVYPLLTTQLELVFEPEKELFKLMPVSIGTQLELEPLQERTLANQEKITELARFMKDSRLTPWDEEIAITFSKELAEAISSQGCAKFELISGRKITGSQQPVIYHAPLLFLRNRFAPLCHRELARVMEELARGGAVPATLQALLAPAVSQPQDAFEEQEWRAFSEEVLFPLPANERQKEIIQRLGSQPGVVVQGPPGTGKSHTIINVIAHLLAHGKRVLVTSQTDRALQVLERMLAAHLPALAPLCVSAVGSEKKELQAFGEALSRITEAMDSLRKETLLAEMTELRQQLTENTQKSKEIKTRLAAVGEMEGKKVLIGNKELTPLQLAKWLAGHRETCGWLPDEVDAAVKLTVSEADICRLYDLLKSVGKEGWEGLSRHRPMLEKLPEAEQLAADRANLEVLAARQEAREDQLKGWVFSAEAPHKVHNFIQTTEAAMGTLSVLSEGWLSNVLEDIVHGDNRIMSWQDLVNDCKKRIRTVRTTESKISEYAVTFPAAYDLRQVREDAGLLGVELTKHDKPSLLFKMLHGKKCLYIMEHFKINGFPVRTVQDIQVLLHYTELVEAKQKLALKWNHQVKAVHGPSISEEDPRMLQTLERYLELLQTVFMWKYDQLTALTAMAADAKPQGRLEWSSPPWLERFRQGLLSYEQQVKYQQLQQDREAFVEYLKEGMAAAGAHSSWKRLYEAYKQGDGETWQAVLEELRSLRELEPRGAELKMLRNRLSLCAPLWLAQLENSVWEDPAAKPPVNWKDAWEWKKGEGWLKKQLQAFDVEAAYRELNKVDTQARELLLALVEKAAWYEELKKMGEGQKGILHSGVQLLRRLTEETTGFIGKTGKQEIKQCRNAIPVWIMPLYKVLETFPPGQAPFDVVIVDESSQCDIFALSVLLRGKRAIIVGDDRQISPQAAGLEERTLYKLIDEHLAEVPQRERFTPEDSLYDTALRVFPGQQVVMKEHFRCVPEIIQFSNDIFYSGTIEPLKIPPNDRLMPPLVAVKVEGEYAPLVGVNEPEAYAIASKIAELCSKADYADKTIGVISLQGQAQATLIEQQLVRKIGERAMLQHRLVCGDAYSFQGDERDVVFLSMVAAPNLPLEVLNKRTDRQYFNVAASRAKEQLWLFHSVELADLERSCIRYRLLAHCVEQRTMTEGAVDAVSLFEKYGSSDLLQEVYAAIAEQGYYVLPEYRISSHPYRIDLVVEGTHTKLAIACEGDCWPGYEKWEAKHDRQKTLERVGWKFFRIRGSRFYLDKQSTLQELWKTLDSMGIRPYQKGRLSGKSGKVI